MGVKAANRLRLEASLSETSRGPGSDACALKTTENLQDLRLRSAKEKCAIKSDCNHGVRVMESAMLSSRGNKDESLPHTV